MEIILFSIMFSVIASSISYVLSTITINRYMKKRREKFTRELKERHFK